METLKGISYRGSDFLKIAIIEDINDKTIVMKFLGMEPKVGQYKDNIENKVFERAIAMPLIKEKEFMDFLTLEDTLIVFSTIAQLMLENQKEAIQNN